MLADKSVEDVCPECGETMEVVRDYGMTGQALECNSCGFSREEIELRKTTLSNP
ncbi:MAG: hypothetical protein M3N53_12455 [Actinomycetota bacterium]|nr:hypothetical protein [Actinomycetota bacterium]